MLHGNCCEPAAGLPGRCADYERTALVTPPAEVAARLAPLGGLVWLDSAVVAPGSVSILTAAPREIIEGNIHTGAGRIQDALVRHHVASSGVGRMPAGGLFGWIGFDGGFVFGVYPHCLVYEHDTGQWRDFGGLSGRLQEPKGGHCPAFHFAPQVDRADFIRSVVRAREYIAAGDIYQVNLSWPWSAPWPPGADALAFYDRLRAASPAPCGAFMDLVGTRVCSASPECFLQMSGRSILTRPIKGTRPRFPDDPSHDARSAHDLLHSEKERAELLMITDLERNDLGIVCRWGSIAVPGLWEVESFAQVHHLVSTITGELRDDVDHVTALRACFPGGSISGAPKKRALEIIRELERFPRGLYTGAAGFFGFNGESQFNIAIRTAVQQEDRIGFHVGAGIVADSDPEREFEETLHKAAGILRAARV